jgi:hypothetical protein
MSGFLMECEKLRERLRRELPRGEWWKIELMLGLLQPVVIPLPYVLCLLKYGKE